MNLLKGFKYAASLLLLFVLLCACLTWWGLSTNAGTKNLLSATQSRLQNLSYEYVSGNLMEGIAIRDAKFTLKNGTVISGNSLQVFSNPGCWQSRKICIADGDIDKLTIALPASKSQSNEIQLKDLSLLLAIETSGVRVRELIIEHPSGEPVVLHNAELAGTIDNSDITLNHFQARWNKLHLQGSGTLTMQNHYPLDLTGTATRKLGSGTFNSHWKASGNLKSLNLQSEITRPFKADLTGVISLLDRRRPADMSLQWEQMQLPFNSDKPHAFLQNGQIKITGDWPAYQTRGNAEFTGPAIPTGSAELAGTLSPTQLNFEPLTLNTLGGSIDTSGMFAWSKSMRWSFLYHAQDIKPGLKYDYVDGHISGTGGFSGALAGDNSTYRLTDINLNGKINGQALTAVGNLTSNAQGVSLNKVTLQSGENHLTANGNSSDSIKIIFSLDAAEKLLPHVAGDLHGDLTITGDATEPTLEGSVTTSNLRYHNVQLRNAKLSGITRKFGKAYSDLTFRSSTVMVDDRKIDQPELNFHGQLSDHILALSLSSNPLDKADINVTGGFDNHHNWNGTVDSAQMALADRILSLTGPFTAAWVNDNQTLAVQPHCWLYDSASVCIKKSALIGKTGVVEFALKQLPLESIAEWIPEQLQLDGILQSDGNVTWGPNQKPVITVDSYLQNATAKINQKINKKQLEFDIPVATLKTKTIGSKIISNVQLESDKFSRVLADVEISTASSTYPISGNITLSDTELDWIKEFLPDINLLNGTLGGTAEITGSLKQPQVNAGIRLKDGQVQSALLPIEVKDIGIELDISSNDATITGQALANDSPVQIKGSGKLTDKGPVTELRITGSDIKFQHEYAENVILSPDLVLIIDRSNIKVSGNVKVPRANITLQSLNTDGMTLSDDVIVADAPGTAIPNPTVGSNGINTRVNIALGDEVTVNGYGLNAELGGDFSFALASKKPPSLNGQIEVSNGEYKAYGQNLQIRGGVITFTGPLEQTALSIEAMREVKDVLAGVHVAGTLQSPTTNLFSEPPLPEEDIIPYIVLGRSLDLNQGDASLLRKAALLLGVNTSNRVSSKLARNLGIDDFSLSAWGTGDDTQILVSGKIHDRLLLRYGVGVFKNSNSFYLRYDLAERLYLETTQGLESAVDLYYSFDF